MSFNFMGAQEIVLKEDQQLEKLEKDMKTRPEKNPIKDPMLLIFFVQLRAMENLSNEGKPLLDRNKFLHNAYKAEQDRIKNLKEELKDKLHKDGYNQEDQKQAQDLQTEISRCNVHATQIQQEEQELWTINIDPSIKTQRSESNIDAAALKFFEREIRVF